MATALSRRPVLRWLVPAGVTTAVVATAVTVPLIADADAELPARTAEELLVDIAEAEALPFAGTVVQSADVGLPSLPGSGSAPGRGAEGGAGALMSLLSGSTTARVWYSDPTTFRVALQDELAETDVIRAGSDVWYWDSSANAASHVALPDGMAAPEHPPLPESVATPSDAAEMALDAIEPSTEVDVDGTATVAGRAAYELVLRPREEGSTVGSVRLAVDAEHSVPLRVQVFDLDGGDPAVEVGFTSVSFEEPDASVFDFTPPQGATVEEVDPAQLTGETGAHGRGGRPDVAAMPSVVGSGWTSVLVARGVDLDQLASAAGESGSEETTALVDALLDGLDPVSGPYGSGVALGSGLVSVLILDDGRVLAGAVALDVLEAAAMDPAAALDAPAVLDAPAAP